MYFFFLNDTGTPEIYTLSLHDALPINSQKFLTIQDHYETLYVLTKEEAPEGEPPQYTPEAMTKGDDPSKDRKSTRLNSSHANISYAVFCLKKINTDTYMVNTSRTDNTC